MKEETKETKTDVVKTEEVAPQKEGVSITKKIRENPWILATLVLGVLVLIFVAGNLTGRVTGNVVSSNDAGNRLIEYLNTVADSEISLVSVKDEGNMYLVTVEYMEQDIPVYVTKDGAYFTTNLVPIEISSSETQNQQTTQGYSEQDIEALYDFNDCLAEKGVKIYGANWCGYTVSWANTLGGFDAVAPVYVECTEKQDVCSEQEVSGYPTTKINGQVYSGARTIEAIADATGCPAPVLMQELSSAPAEASC